MKYFVLLAGPGEMPAWNDLSPDEQQAGMEQHHAFAQACEAHPSVEIEAGEALDEQSATTLRTRGGTFSVTDGPFAEAAEQLGGFYVLGAPDLDAVIELGGILPAYDIDIRPVLDLG